MTRLDVSLPPEQEAATDLEGRAITAAPSAFHTAEAATAIAEEQPKMLRWRRRDWLLVISAGLGGLLVANAILRHRNRD